MIMEPFNVARELGEGSESLDQAKKDNHGNRDAILGGA